MEIYNEEIQVESLSIRIIIYSHASGKIFTVKCKAFDLCKKLIWETDLMNTQTRNIFVKGNASL